MSAHYYILCGLQYRINKFRINEIPDLKIKLNEVYTSAKSLVFILQRR